MVRWTHERTRDTLAAELLDASGGVHSGSVLELEAGVSRSIPGGQSTSARRTTSQGSPVRILPDRGLLAG